MTDESTSTEAGPVPAAPSPWPIIGWLLLAAAVLVVGIAALAGLLMPAVVLDIVSFWPAWVVALLVALALWPLHRRGIARIGAVLPLLLFSWLGAAVGLHLLEWDQLPSAAADLIGPDAAGITAARVGVQTSGLLVLRSGAESLYEVRLIRTGGPAGPPDALERLVPSLAQVQVTERGGAGWFRSAGWTMELNRGPSWEIDLAAPEVDVSIRGLDVRGLRVTGDGTVRIGPPAVEAFVALDGDLTLIVPAGTAVQVRGAAGVPGTWEATETGSRSPGSGPLVTVDVADGAVARVQES